MDEKAPGSPVMSNERLLHIANVFVEDLQATVDKLTDEVRKAKEELDRTRRMIMERDASIQEYREIILASLRAYGCVMSEPATWEELNMLPEHVAKLTVNLYNATEKLSRIREITEPLPTLPSQPDDSDCPVPPVRKRKQCPPSDGPC